MEWDAVFQEVAAVVSVYPDALHECAVRHVGGRTTAVVSGGRICGAAASENGGASAESEVQEDGAPIDVTALEERLSAAVGETEPADMDVDQCETSWVPDWVGSQLGAGISLLCIVSPEECPGAGISVHVFDHANDEPAAQLPRVQHLPPLRVAVHCTEEYPATEPALEVYASWLQKEAVEQVVHAMRAAAADLGEGSPVLLTWLECARLESARCAADGVAVRPGCGSTVVRSLAGVPAVLVRFSPPMVMYALDGWNLQFVADALRNKGRGAGFHKTPVAPH